mmetsp:Transcript_17018/g.33420  ORF Transcript_17018/g.33420 Transcript_17018/m.33420 type:complete len:112 (+) Transcript_17018:364-699(+)
MMIISDSAAVQGAAAAGFLAGCVICGPLLGVIAAGAAFYAATKAAVSEVREASMGVGRCAVLTFRAGKKFCEDNEVPGKLSRAFIAGLNTLSCDKDRKLQQQDLQDNVAKP